MFAKRTVFVVGAGASAELSLPTGQKLKEQISAALSFERGYYLQFANHEISDAINEEARARGDQNLAQYAEACDLIRSALPAAISIDNFLDAHEGNRHVEFCGKLGIIKAIWQAEKQSKISGLYGRAKRGLSSVTGTWLIPFFQMLTEGVKRAYVDDIFKNVSIICFNYDRCIEIFLTEALTTYYKIDQKKSEELVSGLNIIHPYGSVGHFDRRNDRFAPLGGEGCSLRKFVPDIRTFNEGLKVDGHRSAIIDALCDAKTLVFLGFAYHPINMNLLEVDRPSQIESIFGTAKGMGEPSIKRVSSDILRILSKQLFQPAKGGMRNIGAVHQMEIEENTSHDFLIRHFRGIV